MKSQEQKDFEKTFKQPSRKRCNSCGSPEGLSPEGKQVRMVRVSDGVFACNYCANQSPDETIRGHGRRYGEFETVTRVQAHPHAVTDGFEDGFERQGSYNPA